MKKQKLYIFSLILFLIAAAASAQVTFTDVTAVVGQSNVVGAAGGTWGDYDNDGDVDLFLFRGGAGKALYRNEGDVGFVDVTQSAGITDLSRGASTAIFLDFDNDGDLDLFMGGEGSNLGDVLYRNNGDGTFLNISETAGMESTVRMFFGAVSFDYDDDGLLDIYVANWQLPNFLYHNKANGRFREIAAQIGLDMPGDSDGIALGDYDDDGDLDILITTATSGAPQTANVLYRNEGDGMFIDVTQQARVWRKAWHKNAFFWDYDNDGHLDLFIHSWPSEAPGETNILYRNNGDGTFTDVTQAVGIALIEVDSSGAYYGDYDNDGWLDLCVTYHDSPTRLYHNKDGTFTNVRIAARIGGTNSGTVSFVDYDNDGDLDIFTGKSLGGSTIALYRNDGTPNHWLQLKLVGAQSNQDAIGARVKVMADGLSMLREVAGCSGGWYGNKQDRLPVHFGLGQNLQADMIEIRWPSGIIQTFTNILANQRLTIVELEGILVVVHSVFPTFGYPEQGTPVRIQGEHFLPGTRVFFGGVEANNVRVVSPSLITAVTPPGAVGLVDVEVVNPDGKRDILKDGFRYTTLQVTRITPESGPVTGGITVQLDGFGFQLGAQVQIGGKPLANAFVTPTLIRGTLPSGTPGTVDVSVTNPDGEKDVLYHAFTYISPPIVEHVHFNIFVPLRGGGDIVIKGSGFIRTPTVQIGGIAAQSVEFISASELNVRTPKTSEVGPKDVVVINPDGQRDILSNGVTVLAPIKIKSIEPTSAGLAGGTKITIVGEPTVEVSGRSYPSRFVERVNVFIGEEEATDETIQSDHVITARTPPNTPGPKDITVVNPDGEDDTLENAFIYNPLPQITRVIPDNGRLAGGTKITIQGGGFLSDAKVLFKMDEGSFARASEVQVVSDTLITAQTPSGEPGPKDVVVRNTDGQEIVLQGGFTYNPMPSIRSVSPNHGPTSGGTKLLIEGTGFLQGAKVLIGKHAATTEVKDESMIEAVSPANPQGVFDVRVINPDTQEAVKHKGFTSVGEVAYNYPNPFRTSQGTTFRYVTNERVESITVKIFNLAGVPIGVVGQSGSNEVRWYDVSVHAGLYVYLMEVKLDDGKVKKFKRMLEVYK